MTALFTNRRNILMTLADNARRVQQGSGGNIALIGLRRIGKTETIRHFRQEHPELCLPFVNLEARVGSPETFCSTYVEAILRELARLKGTEPPENSTSTALRVAAVSCSDPVRRKVEAIANELEREQRSVFNLVQMALDFPELVAQHEGVYPLMCLDEFQALLELGNFPGLRNIVAVFRGAVDGQERARYLIAGSAISLMEELLTDPSQPLFAHFRIEHLLPFERLDTYELTEKIWQMDRREYTDEAKLRVWMLSFGHPFYITAIAEAAGLLSVRLSQAIDPDLVGMAFVEETLKPTGRIALSCKHVYDHSIGRARGKAILRDALRVLAGEEGLIASQVARRLRRRASNLARYLHTLVSVDLLHEVDNCYYFRDPVLRFWLSYAEMGVPFDEAFTDLATARRLSQEFEERYLRVSAEMGRYFEGHVRDLCHRFQGQTVDGRFFNVEGKVQLPSVSEVSSLEARDEEGGVHGHPSQVELDLYLQGERVWLGEVKHGGGPMNREDLELLVRKAEFFREEQGIECERLWVIANEGFKETAREYAAEQGILTSARFDLRKLGRVVGK